MTRSPLLFLPLPPLLPDSLYSSDYRSSPNHFWHQPEPSRPPLLLCFLRRDTRSPFLIGEDTHLQEWEGRKPDKPIRSLLTSWGRRGWAGSRLSCSPGAVVSSNCLTAEGIRASNPSAALPGGMADPFSAASSHAQFCLGGIWPENEPNRRVGMRVQPAFCSSEFRGQWCLFFLSFFPPAVSSDQIEQLHRRFKQLSGDQPTIR